MVSTTADLTPARRDASGHRSRLRIAAGGREAPPVRGGGDGSSRVPLATVARRNLRALDDEGAAPEELDVIAAEQHLVSLAQQLQATQAAIAAQLSDLRAELGRAAAGLTSAVEELREYVRGLLPDLADASAVAAPADAQHSRSRYHRGWFARHGCPVTAIRRAQAAGDWELATRLLSDHFLGLVLDRQGATAHEVLSAFPAQVVAAHPELAVLLAGDTMRAGPVEAAERYLARASRKTRAVPPDRRARFRVELAVMRLNIAEERGDLPAADEAAEQLLAPASVASGAQHSGAQHSGAQHSGAQQEIGDDLRAFALVTLGAAELWAPRAAAAAEHLAEGTVLAQRIGRPRLEVKGLAHWAMTARFGPLAAATERGTRAIALARRHGWTEDPDAGIAYLALASIKGWQGRLDEADRLLDHAQHALRTEVKPAAGLALHAVRAAHELARGRPEHALTACVSAEKLASVLVTPHPLVTQLRAFLVQVLVRLGENDRAEATLAEAGDQERETGDLRIARAVLRLAQQDPQAATATLGPVLDGSAPLPQPVRRIEALLLDAIARHALGGLAAAGSALERALDLAERDGIVLPFLLHPAAVLLERQTQIRRGAALPEPLTDSEIRVLRYLATTHLAGPEIARELFISVNTVRTHMRHIYEKLGVHRRSEAVERACLLGLLAPSPNRPTWSPGQNADGAG